MEPIENGEGNVGETLKKVFVSGFLILVGTFLGGILALFLGMQIMSFLYASPSGYLGDGYQQMVVFIGTPIGWLFGFIVSVYLVGRYYWNREAK